MVFVALYFIIMIGVALYSEKRVVTFEDYFVSGRKLTVWLATPTIVATWFGAGSFLGVSATVYGEGLGGVIADPFGSTLALLLAALFFASRFRRQKKITVIEVIRANYGKVGETVTSFLTLPFYIGTLGAQICAISIVLSAFFGITVIQGVFIAFPMILIYTLLGGMWSLSMTDGLQLIFLTVALLSLFLIYAMDLNLLSQVGVVLKNEFTDLLPWKHEHFGYFSYFGMWVLTGLGSLMGQDLVQRFFSCKDARTARISTLLAAPIYLSLAMLPILLGVIGRLVVPEGADVIHVIPYLVEQQGSELFSAFFLIGILSVTMSTADSYLLAGSAIVTKNILRIGNHENNGLMKARLASVGIGLIAFVICLFTQDVYALLIHSGVFLFVALFFPVTAALYMKKIYAISGLISMASGVLGWLICIVYNMNLLSSDFDSVLYAAAFIGGLSSCAGFFIPHLILSLRKEPLSA